MTITSSGHIIISSITSAGEFLVGNFTMSGAMLLGVTEPVYIYPILEITEDNEMKQYAGTTKSHPVQLRSLANPADIITEITDTPVFTVKRYTSSGTIVKTTPTLTVTAYDNDTREFDVEIPNTLAATAGEGILVNVNCNTGDGDGTFYVTVEADPSTFATASALSTVDGKATAIQAITDLLTADPLAAINAEVDTALTDFDTASPLAKTADITALNNLSSANVQSAAAAAITAFDTATPIAKTSEITAIKGTGWTNETLKSIFDGCTQIAADTSNIGTVIDDIKGVGWTDETLVAIQAAAETGGTGTGGGGLVIGNGDYTFDASAKTITLSDTTITLEQIQEIRNLTKGKMLIYDSTESSSVITVAAGVISWTVDFAYRGEAFADTDILQIVINSNAS